MQINHVSVITIERLDQGHLCPLGEHRDKHVTVGAWPVKLQLPAPQASTLPKELSRQLIRWTTKESFSTCAAWLSALLWRADRWQSSHRCAAPDPPAHRYAATGSLHLNINKWWQIVRKKWIKKRWIELKMELEPLRSAFSKSVADPGSCAFLTPGSGKG